MSGLSGLSFQQVEIFLSVAKYENFTKAANELHMTQASVSRNIAAMELYLGLVLFLRHKRRVHLTNAGKSLAKDLSVVLRQTEKAVNNAFMHQQNQFKRLTIGDSSLGISEIYLLPVTDRFELKNPGVELAIERAEPHHLFESLKENRLDAAFLLSYMEKKSIEKAGLQYTHIIDLPPCIVIANRHPLFQDDDIDMELLFRQPVVAIRGAYEDYWDRVREICQEIGLELNCVKFVDTPHTLAMELKRGKYIAILDRCFSPADPQELRYISLDNCKTQFGIVLAYSAENDNPYLRELISICRDFYNS